MYKDIEDLRQEIAGLASLAKEHDHLLREMREMMRDNTRAVHELLSGLRVEAKRKQPKRRRGWFGLKLAGA